MRNTGPIPKGNYSIGNAFKHPKKEPVVMRLTPSNRQTMFGRSGFLIHGNYARNDASQGCIVLLRPIRKQISASSDRALTVVL
jgi:hypothetical protein